jgi:hypothetical protein
MGRKTFNEINNRLIPFFEHILREYKRYKTVLKTVKILNKLGLYGSLLLLFRLPIGLWEDTIIGNTIPEVNFTWFLFTLFFVIILYAIKFSCRKHPKITVNQLSKAVDSIDGCILPALKNKKGAMKHIDSMNLPLLPKNKVEKAIKFFGLSNAMEHKISNALMKK